MPINRPDDPLRRTSKDSEGAAEPRERGPGAHAEQDALNDPDATAGPRPDTEDRDGTNEPPRPSTAHDSDRK